MSDLEQRLAAIKTQADQARQAQSRAEALREQAQGAVLAAQQQLAAEFPELQQMTPEDLLARLEQQARAEVSKVEAALAVAAGGQA
jgi:hypothetical protein